MPSKIIGMHDWYTPTASSRRLYKALLPHFTSFSCSACCLPTTSCFMAQSPTPQCYVCPDTTPSGATLRDEEPNSEIGILQCRYSNNNNCLYILSSGNSLGSSDEACYSSATNSCEARHAAMRARALPKSPRAPSPGAFAKKPEVMKTRAQLQKEKAKGKRA
ncbi:hypothetical protein BKA70DRAFT_774294 [Coprinopsis sp. MPI-PUGE-AT-0042]|nr:hypothetical protein BKA70DRAFT_774294 [Coprinopsis sp. MPI-PUGE-AT-0042]